METSSRMQSASPVATHIANATSVAGTVTTTANKYIYSAPASPVAMSSVGDSSTSTTTTTLAHSSASASSPSPPPTPPQSTTHTPSSHHRGARSYSPASGATVAITTTPPPPSMTGSTSALMLSTPKKSIAADTDMLQRIRETLRTPNAACELLSLSLESAEPVNVIKHRYLISTQPCKISAAAAAKTPASYRHLIDLTSSNLKCTDVFTEEQFLCKIINEPVHKVQRAYFQLQQEGERCCSSIYGHPLIRGVHDIVPLSKQRTYVIIAAPPPPPPSSSQVQQEASTDDVGSGGDWGTSAFGDANVGVYEDLHTYIRNKRRLGETEARALFHQICETVQVCHRNGIILRDLKLKRFYFIDEARTKLQYESLEGSMILDDPADDTLSDKIGCPLYTAPELLCPNPTYRGKPADMWSLGVILYTMLVGQYPFYEKGNCNLITIIRHCHVQIPMSLSKSVRWLLLFLLRKNHEERIQAAHIFKTPWLKEQRPYYTYIPVDVVIPDDVDDDDVDADGDDDEVGNAGSGHNGDEDETCETSFSTLSMSSADDDNDEDMQQPLDYRHSTLQMEVEHHQHEHENQHSHQHQQSQASVESDDVDMG